MADQIMECTVERDGESIVQYDISYQVEHLSDTNSFCIVVKADGMTDSSNQDEAIALANIEAKDLKDVWIASLPLATTEILISDPVPVDL